MAECPKCGKHIKVWQMSPYCKNCGVHIMFASFEEQFEKDRRLAEMSMANFRYLLEKLKSAYVSGKAQKLKLVSVLFPLIALLIPFGSYSVSTPVYSSEISFNLIGLFIGPFFLNGLFGNIDMLSTAPVFGESLASLKTLMLIYAVPVISAVIILLAGLLCFIGNKKVQITTIIFSVIGMISTVFCGVFAFSMKTDVEGCFNVSVSFLFVLSALLFAVPLAFSVLCLRNPPVYNFREGDELRVEYRRKYKKGEIKLSDIPAPIYESEEDRKERQKLISEAYNMNEEEVEAGV